MKFHFSFYFLLIFVLIFTLFPSTAFAESGEDISGAASMQQEMPRNTTEDHLPVITQFQPFASDIEMQIISAGSEALPVFPSSVPALIRGKKDFIPVDVVWDTDSVSAAKKVGSYTYTPELKDPDKYSLAESAALPSICIEVIKEETSVKGLSTTLKKKARSSLSDQITVSPADGRSVELQICKSGKWITKKTFSLDQNKEQALNLIYPNDWWKEPSFFINLKLLQGK